MDSARCAPTMTAVDGVVPSPSPSPSQPRPAVAPQARSRLALLAADAATFLCVASSLVVFAGFATLLVGARVCGQREECPLIPAALITLDVAMLSVTTFFVTMLLLSKPPDIEKKGIPVWIVFGRTAMVAASVFAAICILLVVVGSVMVDKGSRRGKIGYVMLDVGGLGAEFLICFGFVPNMALGMWRMMRRSNQVEDDPETWP